MGWRGALRSLGAAARASERNAKRHARQRERYTAAVELARSRQKAADAVREFNARVAHLVSIHKSGSPAIDWKARACALPPSAPERITLHENTARQKLDGYSPWRITTRLGLAAKRRARLAREVESAAAEDALDNIAAAQRFESATRVYLAQKDLAQRLLSGDEEAAIEAIRGLNPFASISDLGSSVNFSTLPGRRIAAEVKVHGETVVPKQTISLLKSGRASAKEMAKGSYYGLYRDYVCSAVLRIARELFAILPVDAVMITAVENLLNGQTGNLEDQPVVSVYIPRQTFSTLNLSAVDPFECMKNFTHTLDFRPTSGFRPVKRLDVEKLGYLGA
jgi:hypothetical protein